MKLDELAAFSIGVIYTYFIYWLFGGNFDRNHHTAFASIISLPVGALTLMLFVAVRDKIF